MTENTPEPTTMTNETQQPQQQLILTLNDFLNIKNIIEVGSKNGNYHPNEMQAIGTLYTKITTLIRYMQAAQQEQLKKNDSSNEQ